MPLKKLAFISISGYDFEPYSLASTDKKVETLHRIAEAFKFSYAQRTFLGDEDYVDLSEVSIHRRLKTI